MKKISLIVVIMVVLGCKNIQISEEKSCGIAQVNIKIKSRSDGFTIIHVDSCGKIIGRYDHYREFDPLVIASINNNVPKEILVVREFERGQMYYPIYIPCPYIPKSPIKIKQ